MHNILPFLSAGPPQIVGGPRDQYVVNDGSSAVFECTAIADPEHTIEWAFIDANGVRTDRIVSTDGETRTDRYYINSNRTDGNFGELTVSSVEFGDRGTYFCVAQNSIGSESAQANLTVHG